MRLISSQHSLAIGFQIWGKCLDFSIDVVEVIGCGFLERTKPPDEIGVGRFNHPTENPVYLGRFDLDDQPKGIREVGQGIRGEFGLSHSIFEPGYGIPPRTEVPFNPSATPSGGPTKLQQVGVVLLLYGKSLKELLDFRMF